MHIIFKNLTCADWPKWPKTSPEWHKNEKNCNCFGNLYQTSYLNSWILIFAPADCTKLKTKDKLGQIQKTSWHFSGYIVHLGCPKLSFTNGLINKAKGWRVDVYSSDTWYKDVKRWKTRPDTGLPQSRAGGQGLFLRSLDHLGRSSGANTAKKQKS